MATIILFSCGQFTDPRKEYAGDYTVRIELDKKLISDEAVQDTINSKMAELKEKLAKAETEMKDSFNLESIDTTTPEGRMEYAAKSFAKGMTGLLSPLGELGKSFGEMGAGFAKGGIAMLNDLVGKMKFNVSLNANGTINTDYDSVDVLGTRNSTWNIEDNKFQLISKDNKIQSFDIVSKKEDGFVLRKDENTKLIFEKK